MTFLKFSEDDLIFTEMRTYAHHVVQLNGDSVTGSVYLEEPFLTDALNERLYSAFSEKHKVIQEKLSPFSSSIDIIDVENGATNDLVFHTINNLYNFYSLHDPIIYTPNFTGSTTNRFRVVNIPAVYLDYGVLSGSLTCSDHDKDGNERRLYDNGRGGIYSGSLTGTLVGNVFYSEGLVVLKGNGLNDEGNSNDFGEASSDNFKWKIEFRSEHKIPVRIFRCRAVAGELNASTNSSFYTISTGTSEQNRYQKQRILPDNSVYIDTIGIYNDQFELVAIAKLAQPIKKTESDSILFRLRQDW